MKDITKEKTNVDHLRDLIKGNEEANEFLDAIVSAYSEAMYNYSENETDLNDQISTLKGEMFDMENTHMGETIDAGIGTIEWKSDSLPLQSLMETLEEKLKKHTPLQIENLLNALT